LKTGGGLDGAHADLFQDAKFLVCPQPGMSENVVRLATDFVTLLGATPILSDASEADGLLAAMVTLPKLLAVSLVDVTMDKSGWADACNLAGRSYGMAVAAAFNRDEAEGLIASALANRDNLIRVLDGYIASLREMRNAIQDGERESLGKKISAAQNKAYDWLAERHLEKYRISDSTENKNGSGNSLGARLRQSLFGSFANRNQK
jgi:prephenate dehydrogenase